MSFESPAYLCFIALLQAFGEFTYQIIKFEFVVFQNK